jgi:hypothetical protein
LLAAPAALLLTWLALGVVHVAVWVRRELDERRRERRAVEEALFHIEARAARRGRYAEADELVAFWR